ncbi:FtsW/RodA/SpoVE family cell cycle protein, partial [Rickettsia endosymbiont of Cardiosporidium cionae]|uniref:FtsW/RodA/SpoVE family cell cycle protein n=1 Tax=Rickettsia endosymbiont of Cardiosporidium cionae TaxID=2777155 RepID=UPI001895206D
MINRHNRSILGNWWWIVDRPTLIIIIAIILFGNLIVLSSGPAIAEHIGAESNYFIKKHLIFSLISISLIIVLSFLPTEKIKNLSIIGLIVTIILVIVTIFYGVETKGAKRWISILGQSLQPSEFMKVFFIITAGRILSGNHR